MQDGQRRDEEFESAMTGLARLREASLIDDIRHDSLRDILLAAKREIDDLDAYFAGKLREAESEGPQIVSARSVLVRSAAVICRHLSEFETAMMKHPMEKDAAVRGGFSWILKGLFAEIEKFSKSVHVSEWSISASAGLPAGISFTVTLSFS